MPKYAPRRRSRCWRLAGGSNPRKTAVQTIMPRGLRVKLLGVTLTSRTSLPPSVFYYERFCSTDATPRCVARSRATSLPADASPLVCRTSYLLRATRSRGTSWSWSEMDMTPATQAPGTYLVDGAGGSRWLVRRVGELSQASELCARFSLWDGLSPWRLDISSSRVRKPIAGLASKIVRDLQDGRRRSRKFTHENVPQEDAHYRFTTSSTTTACGATTQMAFVDSANGSDPLGALVDELRRGAVMYVVNRLD
ncbi:hypothetical protein C8R45DRAFT_966263 [Mycena sanguinolenta]|nr:hypothetical protein C8R45DRAFT_966263 [Mycena sanguinolenta]